MALLELWGVSRADITNKHVQQIIAIVGDGKLRDEGNASTEFRTFLSQIPSALLTKYGADCLDTAFADSGLALQDIVNEIGRRLDFSVAHGRYRGGTGKLGYDGIWRSKDGHALVVEVKTTDAYRIDLDAIAGYRHSLVKGGGLAVEKSSILIVVGRQDTGDLEAQIRGSRHAWDIRLISTDALIRLLVVKEEVDDPETQGRIHHILRPREFTRLDAIVDVVFSTAEDIKQEEKGVVEREDRETDDGYSPKFTPVSFHEACIARLEKYLRMSLIKRSRTAYHDAQDLLRLTCAISREHVRPGYVGYWFAFHPHQYEFLKHSAQAKVVFGCGSSDKLLLIPFTEFVPWLENMNETITSEKRYRHVHISKSGVKLELHLRHGKPRIDLTKYLVP